MAEKVTIYARVGDSEVLNEVAQILVDAVRTPIDERQHGDADDAVARVSIDIAAVLRAAADSFEQATPAARPDVSAALHRIHQG